MYNSVCSKQIIRSVDKCVLSKLCFKNYLTGRYVKNILVSIHGKILSVYIKKQEGPQTLGEFLIKSCSCEISLLYMSMSEKKIISIIKLKKKKAKSGFFLGPK